jgi:transposase InsO family protein
MDHRLEFPVEKMCQVLGVSRSGYYRWYKHLEDVERLDDDLDGLIQRSFETSRETYGSPRIWHDLAKQGIRVSRATVGRRMRRKGLIPKHKKRWITTTDSAHDLPVADNVLGRDFEADTPATKWVSDITYFEVDHQWHYLTIVLDLADRAIVSWVISDEMTAQATTVAALKKAVARRKPKDDLVFHSDRGSQYSCGSFREELAAVGATQSMSRKGNCWDNAVAESFFKTIKTECIDRQEFRSPHQAWSVIFDYIEGWYNTNRIHTTLKGLTVRQAYEAKTKILN